MSRHYLTALLAALDRLQGGLSLGEVIDWLKVSPRVHLSRSELERLIARLGRERV